MSVHRLKTVQRLNGSKGDIWDYVSRPRHLEYLTPKWMHFEIQNENEFDQIHRGLIIQYSIKALPYLPIRYRWHTEITEMVENEYFVYHQRIGPYKHWKHRVELTETESADSMELRDEYEYILPFGFIGESVHKYYVHGVLQEICAFRRDRLSELF